MNSKTEPVPVFQSLINDLEQNIRSELEVQLEIQALLDQQLDVLVSGGTEKLPGVLEKAEIGLRASEVLETERSQIIRKIAAAFGQPVHEITLDKLQTLVGENTEGLREAGEELKQTLIRIREDNRTVHMLIRHSLLFIDDLIRAVSTSESDAKLETYTNKGRPATSAARVGAEG